MMLSKLNKAEMGRFATVLWGIWKKRNDEFWKQTHANAKATMHLALHVHYDWLTVKIFGRRTGGH